MSIKLICIDMDGTLLKDETTVHEDNIKAIKKAVGKGVKVAIATGRMFTSARHFSAVLEIETPIIAGNGSYIRERHTGNIIAKFNIGKENLLKVTSIIDKHKLNYGFFCPKEIIIPKKVASNFDFHFVNEGLPEVDHVKITIYEDMKLAIEENQDNILECIIVEDENHKALKDCKRELKESIEDVEVVSSFENNVEIMKKGVSKGSATKNLAEIYKINQEEIMCIGDNENDLSMIEFAGIGVAMGNAVNLLKERADYITTENTKGGVARAIEKFVLNP